MGSILRGTMSLYKFSSDGITFTSKDAAQLRTIYAPLCSPDSSGIKSAITPNLAGDIKIDKHQYLTKPASTEDLRNNTRDFFFHVHGKGVATLTGGIESNSSSVEIGQLWHKLTRRHDTLGIELEVINFVPASGEHVEIMIVKCANISETPLTITPTSCIPIFGRPLSNKHDHEHVTSLFHRTVQLPNGVVVSPTMIFNEEGHRVNSSVYYVLGCMGDGKVPIGTFPTADSFCRDSGTWFCPAAIMKDVTPTILTDEQIHGKEAVGALRFSDIALNPGESKEYILILGIGENASEAQNVFKKFNSTERCRQALEANKKFWSEKTSSIAFKMGDKDFDSWMRWVTLQPILRRIFGCSFLPDHDYGKGGKGWRDIWQDLLSLILIEPGEVRDNLINNFAGVRIDGSNATIIGSLPGEFLADRNAITRVWMDHGVWPYVTLLLYINQTGDYDILLEKNSYFRDPQLSRTFDKDWTWTLKYGYRLKNKSGKIYQGTIVEHLLVQLLVQFFNVGEHNITRLENADWNDGLDMAFNRGESVAFMSMYGGNLLSLADLLENLAVTKNVKTFSLFKEIKILLDTLSKPVNYNNIAAKKKILFDQYFKKVQPEISGEQVVVKVSDIVTDLRKKAQWIFEHIRKHEKVSVQNNAWFNGYYDNTGLRVEGKIQNRVRMTLTGQVFAIMSGLASDEEIKKIVQSVRAHLQDKKFGGFRLNTDFGVPHYLELGRAFGFAYGTKENGAFFSHMNVMYAYALYSRGFAREGYEVLESIYRMSMDSERSKIYPGIPEYFDSEGRGRYHYLTGSASWFVLTQLTQVFGVRGEGGDLVLAPKLVAEQFDAKGEASVTCHFAGKIITVIYVNKDKRDYGQYAIKTVSLNGKSLPAKDVERVIKRSIIEKGSVQQQIVVELG